MRQPFLSFAIALAASGVAISSIGAAQAAPKPFTNCGQVKAVAPFGVAKDTKAAVAGTQAGLVPLRVSSSLYKRAARLDSRNPKGFVCGTKVAVVRQLNADGYFRGTNSNDPADVVKGIEFAVPNSPAANYLRYLGRSTEATTWSSYQVDNKIVPTKVAPRIKVSGDMVTSTSGTEQQQYTAQFEPFGKLETWSTEAGPLTERLFAVQGSSSGFGITIEADWTYRTIRGPVLTTAYATNNSGRQLRLAKATYRAPDGGNYEGYTTGTCINSGQRIPVNFRTDASAPASGAGSWRIEVLACTFSNVGAIDVNFGPR